MKPLTDKQRAILRTPFVRELKRIRKAQDQLERQIDNVLAGYTRKFSPVRKGDIARIRQSNGSLVYVIVVDVGSHGYDTPAWSARGRACKKDGTPLMRKRVVFFNERTWNADCTVVRRAAK